MRPIPPATLILTLLLLAGAAAGEAPEDPADQVRAAESAFARTMADRDLEAFASFLSDEALFFGPAGVLRGKDAVVAGWAPFFTGEAAPFSWSPESVDVIDSGTLAHSSGPVLDAAGTRVATFNSVWRLEPDGSWKVVFDKGCVVCE